MTKARLESWEVSDAFWERVEPLIPQRLVRRYIEAGQLWRVPHAPQFKLPAYMVFPRDSDNPTLKLALDGLRELARIEQVQGD